MLSYLVVYSSLLGLCFAQAPTSSTVPIYVNQGLHRSAVVAVITSDATATTYLVGCPTATSTCENMDSVGCYAPTFTFTQGPKTAIYTTQSFLATITIQCSLAGTTSAACTYIVVDKGAGVNNPTAKPTNTYTSTSTGTDVANIFAPRTIVSKLDGIDSTYSILPFCSATRVPTATSSTTARPTNSSTASAQGISATSTSSNGVTQPTGSVWVVRGVVIAVALAGLN